LSKAGVIYLTKSLARLLAKDGITVNAVSPGRTATDMTGYDNDYSKLSKALSKIPLGAINTSGEIATSVLYLASDQAHNITGQIIGIDGGEALF
jgi:NAD(P)-dependent dehydrogenase (short-subunit alcohol dehydrogenase family)